jgi:long-chain acyl-CoA synthetase
MTMRKNLPSMTLPSVGRKPGASGGRQRMPPVHAAGNAMTASIENAMRTAPARHAVVCGNLRHTYGEFYSRCRRLAGGLRDLGLVPGDRVAVVSRNCHRYLELYMAVPAAGLVLVPLNRRLEDGEIRQALADSGTSLLFTEREGFEGTVKSVYSLPSGYERLLAEAEEAGFRDVDPGALAALGYTGGTTGGAKGVMLTHANLAANAGTWPAVHAFSERTRWALIAPMSHLAGTNAVLSTVSHGGCHLVLPAFSAPEALDLIERERATATLVIPTMLALMTEEQLARPRDVSSLVLLSHGGAPAAPATLRRAHEVFPRAGLMEIYGTTETSPNVTFLPAEETLLDSPVIRSCGRAASGVELAVVGADGRPVPPGTVGEVVVRGRLVTAGYWNRPEATAAAMADGWYHTGDLGRLDPDGYLYLLDRKKDVIVTGGENVYSAEVEEVLYRHPLVIEAAVFGVPDERWGEAVHAVVSTRVPAEPAEIIDHCRGHIAGFKLPKSIDVTTEPLPKSGAGKILKRALREPYWAGRDERVSGALRSGGLAERSLRAVRRTQPLLDHRARVLFGLPVRHPGEAVRGHGGDDGEHLPGEVGSAGRRVVVGGVVQRLHAGQHRVMGGHVLDVELLQRAHREYRSRADGVEPAFLGGAAGDVVAEDPCRPGVLVVAGEQRHHD